MEQRKQRWYTHNECNGSSKGNLPLIVMEIKYCIDDYLDLQCEGEFARQVEKELLTHLVNHELVNDDKVIPDYHKIGETIRTVDKDFIFRYKAAVEDIFGDILPVKIKMDSSFNWYANPSKKAEYLMVCSV